MFHVIGKEKSMYAFKYLNMGPQSNLNLSVTIMT